MEEVEEWGRLVRVPQLMGGIFCWIWMRLWEDGVALEVECEEVGGKRVLVKVFVEKGFCIR